MGLLDRSYVVPASCIIKISGAEIADLYPYISELHVNATRAQHTEATITFVSPADETGKWLVADDPRLKTWAAIVIEADFEVAKEELLRGVILSVNLSFPANAGGATVTLTCRDDSAKLDRGVKRTSWGKKPVGTSDAIILQSLAGNAGLIVDPDSGRGLSSLVLLQASSDIAFLQKRAAANGYDLIFSGGKVYFGPMRLALESQTTIMVYAGQATNCRSFTPVNDGHQRRKVAYAKRDSSGDPGSPVTVEADSPLLGLNPAEGEGEGLEDDVEFIDVGTVPDDEQCRAKALAAANRGDMCIRATGELDGSLYGHVLRVAEPVDVDGVGETWSGTYFVDSVTHRFDKRGYAQSFTLIRNALGRKPGGGLLGALASLL